MIECQEMYWSLDCRMSVMNLFVLNDGVNNSDYVMFNGIMISD
jgi:hypothetical protein